jgi:putative oxidoreductase
LGVVFPAACAAFVGLMTVAGLTDHRGKGFMVFKGGWEYVALVGAVAVALALLGPGRWSLDAQLGLKLYGIGWGLAVLLVGVVAGGATVLAFRQLAPMDKNS